ncbi:uncharacterized protein LOC123291793 [Chrysoperla carnea]|uniref:uncharacterized protein LOC123291793 n=1 Tax=Chrysoperla carnea TaxID=189513 RepID=UPI001D0682BE|nr:uncharacterized protein LOC123291793 [Chrysoperla carnea]
MSSEGFVRAQSNNLSKINVLMVAQYFGNCESFTAAETRGVKAHRSQRDNYGDAAVGYVELKRQGDNCLVRGRICPEHRVRNTPYHVELKVNEKKEEVVEVSCKDCAASADMNTFLRLNLHE